MRRRLLFLSFIVLTFQVCSQVTYEPVSNLVYDLLDEASSLGMISLNSVIKPYSRKDIAEKLIEACKSEQFSQHRIPSRIRDELMFYLNDFSLEEDLINKTGDFSRVVQNVSFLPPGYTFRSDFFAGAIRPSAGARFIQNVNGSLKEVSGGGELFGYAKKHVGISLSIKQTWQNTEFVMPEYFSMEEGKVWKDAGNYGVMNTEWRGGISFAWKWGDLGVYKDRPVWGNAEHGSNILSGHAPSFPFLCLHLKPAGWIEFQYIHAWLRSEMVDSTRSSFSTGPDKGNDRTVYRKKYIAANMLTVTPWKGLNLSIGNSVIYSDTYPNPYYLIPLLFYNSVDAERTLYNNKDGSNSQLFIDICSRQIRHLKLYATWFADEVKVSRILDPGRFNFTSWKLGIKLSDFPVNNLSFTVEWTKTNPITYRHFIPEIDFSSSGFNMGHYLRDNSQELFISASFHPTKNLDFTISYAYCEHGTGYNYTGSSGEEITKLPVLKDLKWQSRELRAKARYIVCNRVTGYLEYCHSYKTGEVRYQPLLMRGITNMFLMGIAFGWD